MTEKCGLYVETEKCVGCNACEVACKQEHDFPAGTRCIRVTADAPHEVGGKLQQTYTVMHCMHCGYPYCAYVCPVGAIRFEDIGDTRYIYWPNNKMEFKLKQCKTCGNYWAPEKQLEYIIKKANLSSDAFDNCPDCRE